MKNKIALHYLNGLVLPKSDNDGQPAERICAFVAEMMRFGYTADEKLVANLSLISEDQLTALFNEVIPLLKESVGAHRVHKPFYPNFPKQVMDAEEAELFLNALTHYWSEGKIKPNFQIAGRDTGFESVTFKKLTYVLDEEFDGVAYDILNSKDSISEYDRNTITWFIDSDRDFPVPNPIPFKENVCMVAALYLERGKWNPDLVKDTTDILRIATYLNGGDISLADNTKFKSLPRKQRRLLVNALDKVAREEDFLRHKEKWIKLLHNLHVGEYSSKLYKMAKKLREHKKIETFRGKVEAAFDAKNYKDAVALLSQRPGEFARMVGRLLTNAKAGDRKVITAAFARVVDDVPTRNLLQLWGSMKTRTEKVDKRVVFPKGSVAKAVVLRNELAKIPKTHVDNVIEMITDTLHARFGQLDDLGSVYLDPALDNCPLPTGMRSASEGLKQCARGTHMPIGNKGTLRFFIYWKGRDIDLSATFHDENFNMVSQVSYTNLRNENLKTYHSGDITDAPNGASEFIDIDINAALKAGNVRYVAMNVLVYSGPTFAEHEECFAGWMTRSKPNSNEIFEPKTVQNKVDLRSETKNVIPVMFDLQTREAIWVDVNSSRARWNTDTYGKSGNNVEANAASIKDTVESFVSLDNKITLGELLRLHATARGNLVEDREEADTVFAMDDDATINPFAVTTINSEYVV